ncbi:hypothetical protein SUDANB95_02629 [Actinosynnema sp. ALI-1.44]
MLDRHLRRIPVVDGESPDEVERHVATVVVGAVPGVVGVEVAAGPA